MEGTGDLLRMEVAHGTSDMTRMESPAKGLGASIRRVDDARDVVKNDDGTSSPFLDGVVLNIDVTTTSSGLVFVDHGDSSFVITE